MTFSAGLYRRAVARYARSWQATDEALYALCRRHPGHADPGSINAKLWIIGRTYATGIERKIRSDGKQGGSMSRLAGHLLTRARELDKLFARLRCVKEPLDPVRLRTIFDVHGQFMALIRPVLYEYQSPRSFASKYMHFHCRAVPIIDTYADRACQRLVRWQNSFCLWDESTGADKTYARYLFRFWQLYRQARAAGLNPNVRHLDYCLLCAAEGMA